MFKACFSGIYLYFYLTFFLLSGICLPSLAQNKILKTFYDEKKSQLKEEYHVNDRDTTILDGIYKNFYQNGKIKTVGFYTSNQATDYWEYFYQNGKLRMEGIIQNFFNEGHWVYYYENGQKSMEGQMEKGKKNGYWKYYYEDGITKSEGFLKDGKNDGEWKYYYDDGNLKAKATYNNGEGYYTEFYSDGNRKMEGKIKGGKSDSTWKYYHANGQLKAIGTETNGLKDGEWNFYHENGKLSSVGLYKDGQTNGFWRYFNEEGKLSSEGLEKDGQKDGKWKMFYNNGKIKGEGNFNSGDGLYTEYYDHGKPKVKGQFKKGHYDGYWEYFFEDGSREGECEYFNGEGWYTGYYPSGSKKMEGFLKDGDKTGVWRLYKQDGTIAGYYKTYYDDAEEKQGDGKKQKSDSLVLMKKGDQAKTIVAKPKKRLFPKIRLYKPDPMIYKTFILSVDPVAILLGSLPVYLEYYVQQRWGLEANITNFKKPFFSNFSTLSYDYLYQSGIGGGLRYKKYYSNNEFIGMPYLGGELRYKNITYSSNVAEDSTLSTNNMFKVVSKDEQAIEGYFIVGDRFMRDYDRRGFTVDVFFGLGLGYRNVTQDFASTPHLDNVFSTVSTAHFYVPIRLGISIGYAF